MKNKFKWILRTNDFKSNPLEASIVVCDRTQAVTRGLGQLVKFWIIGLFCILIPVLHFFLVPAFFITGIYFLIKSLKYKYRIENTGSALCPSCQKKIEIKALWFESQVRFGCSHCSEQLVLESEQN